MGPSDDVPVMPPPPGVTPNFRNPETRAPMGLACVWSTTAAMLLFVALRVHSRLVLMRRLSADDFLGRPYGPHSWNIRVRDTPVTVTGRVVIAICVYATCSAFLKASLLLLYRRVFRVERGTRRLLAAALVVIPAYYAVGIVLLAAVVGPGTRRPPLEYARRFGGRQDGIALSMSVFSALSDVFLLVLPLRVVWRLHMPARKKLAVSALLATGLAACCCSIVNTLSRASFARFSADFSWNSVLRWVFATAEVNVGIICSCTPVLWASLQRFLSAHCPRFAVSDVENNPPLPPLATITATTTIEYSSAAASTAAASLTSLSSTLTVPAPAAAPAGTLMPAGPGPQPPGVNDHGSIAAVALAPLRPCRGKGVHLLDEDGWIDPQQEACGPLGKATLVLSTTTTTTTTTTKTRATTPMSIIALALDRIRSVMLRERN